MTATYNEIDEYAADWISNLASAGHVAPGRVDTRSITELTAEDVLHARQAHFFAGIAVWSAAARAAGWPDDAPLWTGSCPCQPFSQAGRGKGIKDERHLWPEWFRLIRECMPPVIVGEQVASPAGLGWLDAVFADLEGAGYACAATDLCAAGVGAPHIRQRLYFVAVARGERLEGLRLRLLAGQSRQAVSQTGRGGEAGVDRQDVPGLRAQHAVDGLGLLRGAQPAPDDMADPGREGRRQVGENAGGSEGRSRAQGVEQRSLHGGALSGALADASGDECGSRRGHPAMEGRAESRRATEQPTGRGDVGGTSGLANADQPHPLHGNKPGSWRLVQPAPHATDGFWRPADWILCSDGKTRAVEPGTFPLAYGATARVGRLRAYGNAIVRPQAQAFLEVVIDMLTATTDPTTDLTKAVNL